MRSKNPLILAVFLLITSQSLFAQRYYWVGMGGEPGNMNWSTLSNWSSTSGGAPGDGIINAPGSMNTIVFDANSNLMPARRTILVPGVISCDSLIVEADCSDTPNFNFSSVATNTLSIGGSLLLKKAGTTFSSLSSTSSANNIRFTSGRPVTETIQTSGTILGYNLANLNFNSAGYTGIIFIGSGSWSLADNLNTSASVLRIQSGTLYLNGKNLNTQAVDATGGKIVFPGSTITCIYNWAYDITSTGALTSDDTQGSLIRVGGRNFATKVGDVYNNVEFYANANTHSIQNGIFNKITFLKGYADAIGNTTVTNTFVTDSLIIQAAGHFSFNRVTVNKYFEAKPLGCGGQVRLHGSSASTSSANYMIYMGDGAVLDVDRAVIHDLGISGTGTYTATKSYDWGNNTGWNFTSPDSGRDMYWIGGGGYWDDDAHWSLASGGSPENCIPTLADNVFFDSKSGNIGSSANSIMLTCNSWCNNMKWDGVKSGNTTIPTMILYGETAQSSLYYSSGNDLVIGGSLEFQSDTMNISVNSSDNIYFVSNRPTEIIDFNGKRTTLSVNLNFNSINGTGKWTLMNNITIGATSYIYFNSGHLDFNGKTVTAGFFTGDNNNTYTGFKSISSSRTLNIANSIIDLSYSWRYSGGQQLLSPESYNSQISVGSSTNSGNFYYKSSLTIPDAYYNVEMRGSSGSIYPYIPSGAPGLGTYALFNKVTCTGTAASINNNNTGTSYQGVIRPDSLLLIGNGSYTINRSFNIENYLGTPLECGGKTILKADAPVDITMGGTEAYRVDIRNTDINNVSIGPGTYNVIDCELTGTSDGWTPTYLPPATYYWVGNNGNWSDGNNWSTKSGLVGGNTEDGLGCVPRPVDNVIFDDGSFNGTGQRVIIDINYAFCDSMSWIGTQNYANNPSITFGNNSLTINGSLLLQPNMGAMSISDNVRHLIFTSNRQNETITTNGVQIRAQLSFNGNAKWTFMDDVYIYPGTSPTYPAISFTKGELDFNGNNINLLGAFAGNSGDRNGRKLNIAGSKISITGPTWNYTGDLNAANSEITHSYANTGIPTFTAEVNAQYHNLILDNYYASSTNVQSVNNGIFNKVQTTRAGAIFNGITTDTLILANDKNYEYQFTYGSTITIKKAFHGNGTPCLPGIILRSTHISNPVNFDIRREAANYDEEFMTDDADTLLIDYVRIHGIKPLLSNNGGDGIQRARLYKGKHSFDEPETGTANPAAWGYGFVPDSYNSDEWIMDTFDPTATRPFGGDRNLPCAALPYRLSSVNFLPPPGSNFAWRRTIGGEIIGEGENLIITEEGNYVLSVDYAGSGCAITDSLTITLLSGDSLIWTGAGNDHDWNNVSNWKHADNSTVEYPPDVCTNVYIPGGLSYYPDLTPKSGGKGTDYTQEMFELASCLNIRFGHGAEVIRTDSLNYNRAYVELDINSNQWYMFSPPVKNIYTGDIYVNDPNPVLDGYWIEPMYFNVVNPQTGNQSNGYEWTGRFNTADELLQPGRGVALWVDEVAATSYSEHNLTSFWFPKADTMYYYYTRAGEITDSTNYISRPNNYRFIYEPLDQFGNVTLSLGAQTVSKTFDPIFIGNPFMAHLNFEQFAARNPGIYDNQFKMFYGVNTGTGGDGKVNLAVTYWYDFAYPCWISTGTDTYGDPDLHMIPPMQSFIVASSGSSTPVLKANVEEVAESQVRKFRSSNVSSDTRGITKLDITTVHGESRNKALLLYKHGVSSEFDLNKDSYQLFPERLKDGLPLITDNSYKPVIVYLKSSDGYSLDIHTIGGYEKTVPVNIRTSLKTDITLEFSGLESFEDLLTIYLHDTKTNTLIDLSQTPVYTFNKDTDDLYLDGRFYLSFRVNTGIEIVNNSGISVNGAAGYINVISNDGSPLQNLRVYDLQGKLLFDKDKLSVSSYRYKVPASGVYIVQAAGKNGVAREKVRIMNYEL